MHRADSRPVPPLVESTVLTLPNDYSFRLLCARSRKYRAEGLDSEGDGKSRDQLIFLRGVEFGIERPREANLT